MYAGYEEVRRANPRETANIFSFLTFGYTIQLFKKGFNGNLQESDIYEVPNSCSSKRCGDKIDSKWQNCKTALRLLIKTFGKKYFLYTSIHLTWHLINSTIHPYATSRFIAYYEKNQTSISREDAYFYGGLVIFVSTFRSLWIYNYFLLECILGIQIRSALTSLLYRKVVKLRPEQVRGSSMGSMLTILTKDIRTIESTIWPLSDLIIGCVKFFYLSGLVYVRVGVPSLVLTAVVSILILIEAVLSKFVLKLRLGVGKMADRRLHFTREILSVLKIIKMYTWEQFFHRRVCEVRKKETRANLRTWYLGTVIITLGTLSGKLLFPIFLITYMSLGYTANTELVYYLMSIFKEYVICLGILLPDGFALSMECYASVVRLGRILNIKELDEAEQYKEFHSELSLPKKIEIDFQKVSIAREGNSILDNISLKIDKPGLYMITGSLGAGKSTILKVVLEEYPISQGQLQVSGSISYVSQDPWLFPATVRQNILFGQPYDKIRYNKVIAICSLDYDFKMLPYGDNTVITDGGLNLSKGQQARVNLARAIYKDSDVYLLDDPLACLDVKVQDAIFQNCIRNYLTGKIVIFVTQNISHLKHAEKLIVMEHGQVRSVTKPDEIIINKKRNYTDSETSDSVGVLGVTTGEENQMKIYHEDKNIGSVDIKNYYRYIKYGGGVLIFTLMVLVFFGAQFTESYSDKLVSKWVDYNQDTAMSKNTTDLNQTSIESENTLYDNLVIQRNTTFELYIIMIGISTILDLLKTYCFLVYCRRASIKFHKRMSQSIINCVMPFLDSHFIGNILNRFSYDLDHIDEVFPFLFKEIIIGLFTIGGSIALIITVDWIFVVIAFLFFLALALLRMFYIPTARALKRLAAIRHLNATVDGLSTIKAFKAENLLKDEFDRHQDLAVSVVYMEMTTSLAFGYAMDLSCSIFITMVILTFLFVSTDTSVGNVGLAITQMFTMSESLYRIVRIWASLEQSMTSVERVVEYIKIPQEDNFGETPSNWPKYGEIEYRNVNLAYNYGSKVLKNVNFRIKAGEKVGIVGRTGAGKSSIISTLFRLYDYQGTILIDGIDSKKLSLELLRKNISLIPQDPIIFAGTVRENIDPYGTLLDKDIWKVLRDVQLKNSVPNLDENIIELSLSTGQKQLLCLARALLKNNRIIVMDEPTANLDAETDDFVQDLMRRCFVSNTLILVAHRLSATMDCDKVVVMENGEIVEFDSPKKLLENEQSLFYQMINILE